MGAVCAFISHNIVLGYGFLARLLNLALAIISGLISYVIFCFILRVGEIQELWRWVAKKGLSPKGTVPDV
jgi:hypothetical protein